MSQGALVPLPGSVRHSPSQGCRLRNPHSFCSPFPNKLSSFTRKDANRGLSCADFREVSRCWPTCGLEDLLLLEGVDGTEGCGGFESSPLADKKSSSWTLAIKKKEE